MEELLYAANEFLKSVGNLSTIPKENIQFTVPKEGFRYINADKPNLTDAITKFTKDVKKLYEMIRMNMELINIHAGSVYTLINKSYNNFYLLIPSSFLPLKD